MVGYIKGVEYGKGHYRHLEQEKIRALALNKGDFEARWRLGKKAKEDLRWWELNIDTADRGIWIETPELKLSTDASGPGWGTVFGREKTNGRWSVDEQELRINILEMKAVLFGLKSFCRDFVGIQI